MKVGKLLVTVAVVGLTATGCVTANESSGAGMMGGTSSSGSGMMSGFGAGMMGSAPQGYHLSRLTCSAPSRLPGRTVDVMVGDMGMTRMMGGVAPLGQHMMLRAVPGQAAGGQRPGSDGKIDETGSLGEASASCAAGSGEGIEAGTVGWVTLSLPVGRYELVCNLANHYANGMRQPFVVTA